MSSKSNTAYDLCLIDEKKNIRGRLTIQIIDNSENFIWNVWTTIRKDNNDNKYKTDQQLGITLKSAYRMVDSIMEKLHKSD